MNGLDESPPSTRLVPAHQLVERALGASRCDACAVVIAEGSEAEVRFANNTTTTNGTRRNRNVAVVCFRAVGRGTSVGVASSTGTDNVEDLVRAAESDARRAEPADDAAALEDLGGRQQDLDVPPALTGVSVLDDVVGELGRAFERARATGLVLAGFASQRIDTVYLGTSTGVRRRHVEPTANLHLVGRAPDGSRSAWAGAGGDSLDAIRLGDLETKVMRHLRWAERRFDLPAGRYETLLPSDATADLMIPLSEAMSGRDAEDGRNVFSAPGGGTRVGDALTTRPFDLRSDPHEVGLACIPFVATGSSGTDVSVFDNGLDIGPTRWIDGGILRRLRYHRAAAAHSGAVPTPPVDNLVLEMPAARSSLEDLVARTDRGLLLTCLWYIREVDPVTLLLTGLTRDGVYLVERGEVVGAVNNFRFNESPLDVLARTTEAGASERCLSREWGEWRSRTRMPPLRVPDFNMSSVSPAN